MAPELVIAAAELREEAAKARDLAGTLADTSAIDDLLKYAFALEADAVGWANVLFAFTSNSTRSATRQTLH